MDVLALYREAGALHEGHFLLASGRHSPMFLQSMTVLQHPRLNEQLSAALAAKLSAAGVAPSFVIGPEMGGVTLAYEVARHLGARALFAEKDHQGGMFVREGLDIAPGEPFVAVEDVLTTGGSVLKTARAAEARGGRCLAIACLVDRRREEGPLEGYPLVSLQHLYFETFAPDALPTWLAARPLREI